MRPSTILQPFREMLAALACVGLVGCASYSATQVQPGQGAAEVLREMGAPTSRYPLVQGGSRLEFARGPFGRHTWMIDLDAAERVTRVEQVLTEAEFNQIVPGMSGDDVLLRLGRPGNVKSIWNHGTLWFWRYENPFCMRFVVTLDGQARVRDSGNDPDPLCEHRDHDIFEPHLP